MVSAEQQVRFLLGIRNGLTVKAAAGWARVSTTAIYHRRRNDAGFAELWREAFAGAKADSAAVRARERAAADAAQGTKIAPHGDSVLMRKRRHAIEFTPERKQVFLDHFADSCNMPAAAAAAGVSVRAVRKALAEDEEFAAAFDGALGVGYKGLEADALCQQQQAYRLCGTGEGTADGQQTFERTMQLLRAYKRPDGSVGRRQSRRNLKHVSKEELVEAFVKAMGLLKKRRALLRKAGKLPPLKPRDGGDGAGQPG
ncbi:MAG TPA: hypothetical protein VEC11_01665 [Allosphingosinicella sp.]|nr:hypothetical protein [Allosphingosinicella sp.]